MSESEWDRGHRRPLEGPLRPAPPRRRLLARADEGRTDGQASVINTSSNVGAQLQSRTGQLRSGQVRDRDADRDRGQGVVALRRSSQRHRAGRPDAAGPNRPPDWATSSLRRASRGNSTFGTRPTSRPSSPGSRPRSVRRAERCFSCRRAGRAVQTVDHDRRDRQGRPLDGERAGWTDGEARRAGRGLVRSGGSK